MLIPCTLKNIKLIDLVLNSVKFSFKLIIFSFINVYSDFLSACMTQVAIVFHEILYLVIKEKLENTKFKEPIFARFFFKLA